jgi:hypothetical protein
LDSEKPKKAKKVYDALSIRSLYQETTRDYINPIDKMLKDFLCKCYLENNNQTFSADSDIARKYVTKNIDRFINDATNKYVDLKLKIYEEDRANKLNTQMLKKIDSMKASSMRSIEKKSNALFNKKKKRISLNSIIFRIDQTASLYSVLNMSFLLHH